jgi:Flp pilus assembly protein TadB
MFVSPLGWIILGLAAALLLIGNAIIRRITAIA